MTWAFCRRMARFFCRFFSRRQPSVLYHCDSMFVPLLSRAASANIYARVLRRVCVLNHHFVRLMIAIWNHVSMQHVFLQQGSWLAVSSPSVREFKEQWLRRGNDPKHAGGIQHESKTLHVTSFHIGIFVTFLLFATSCRKQGMPKTFSVFWTFLNRIYKIFQGFRNPILSWIRY